MIALSEKTAGVFFQRAIAYSKIPPPHQGKSSCYLAPYVTEAVRPVYERLTTDALLSCCLRGMTQNANESLHAHIWQRCPKHLFAGRKRIELATTMAIANFSCGRLGLQQFISAAGCNVNSNTISRGQRQDAKECPMHK
ncbi:hypothetical protein PoB_005609900 [Plakobranchus ocellatus]|uniref:Transposase n=1 Tax=Plakobranchus ocellatus TaxID=259542 RepID=A0AAV4CFN9_9GAST|nr:hypothetical protein PoB_005609900 [Plakobranchus ocellatus]